MLKNQYRFFISQNCFKVGDVLIKDKNLIHQIKDVLRLKIGQQLALLDNSGFEYLVEIKSLDKEINCSILKEEKNDHELPIKITLIQSLLKQDHFEQVLKFCTNIGVSEFLPVITERCVVKEISQNKQERYQKIIKESTEQSGRGVLPKLNKLLTTKELINYLKDKNGLKLIAWEEEKETDSKFIKEKIKKSKEVFLVIGPEGGLEESEISLFKENGFFPFSLGKLILRSEIAGLVASSLILSISELNNI